MATATIKNFDFINGKYVEVSYPCNIGFQSIGTDGLKRNQIMAVFHPDFPGKIFNFIFQIWVEAKDKDGNFTFSLQDSFELKADKVTWLNLTTGKQYRESLPVGDEYSAFEWIDGQEILDPVTQEGTGVYEKIPSRKAECEITNWDYWHGIIFAQVTPVLALSIIQKGYCGVTEII